ncbi:helix-turn-helix transcriptional regulator [Luteolibacter pohnpeiensis]|uniref:Helix-turn-helix transcriptional regulator n=1 Tax=Luteolibacter pohnpeiensis TaxID=454153 RepID=A0A934SC32_9BACT|nr:AraC family transcriptional regulator [Luteolibacter pohnpeiensis]MBK1883422.1 helix-turn-helix transcriptional regulator [Luteolibacter pohnpeiensis]
MATGESELPSDLADVDILGDDTHSIIVRADAAHSRGWFNNAPICPLLGQHHVAHVGIMQAWSPFEIIRRDQSGTFMLACFHGEGVILADGNWKKIRAGQACLQPPFVMNSLKCLPGKPWHFAWVRYQESRETRPIVSAISPVTGPFDAEPLRASINGLHSECMGANAPSALHHWSELIQHYVMRFAQPHQSDSRLWRVWQQVEAELAQPWTLSKLAAIACMSEEHLRRVSRKELGRSPMQHLTFLRLQRARHLLSVTDDKVEVIAKTVGFESIGTFSNTFTKWIGWRPSEHRRAIATGETPVARNRPRL